MNKRRRFKAKRRRLLAWKVWRMENWLNTNVPWWLFGMSDAEGLALNRGRDRLRERIAAARGRVA